MDEEYDEVVLEDIGERKIRVLKELSHGLERIVKAKDMPAIVLHDPYGFRQIFENDLIMVVDALDELNTYVDYVAKNSTYSENDFLYMFNEATAAQNAGLMNQIIEAATNPDREKAAPVE